jgi:hypothetical protein
MLDENDLRLECLKLATAGSNRATSAGADTLEQTIKRAQVYLDFVRGNQNTNTKSAQSKRPRPSALGVYKVEVP